MNHIRWAAWGVIEIDNKERFDRMQRRNYIKKARAELFEKSIILNCGGSTAVPWYGVEAPGGKKNVFAGVDAFKKACQWVLEQLGEHNVSGTDGGVRCATAEAQNGVPPTAV